MFSCINKATISSVLIVYLLVLAMNVQAGQWVAEERDLLADYRLMFGTDPQAANAIAIMTDTDNTGENVEAWYGEISLSTVGSNSR